MARRPRIDSATGAVRAMAAAGAGMPQPPAHVELSDGAMRFWPEVVAEFSALEWTAHALSVAALLARAMFLFDREQSALEVEGAIMKSDRGTPVCNPRVQVVAATANTVLSLRRSLSLHARAQTGEARDVGKRRAISKTVEAETPFGDSLLARPN